MANKPDNLQIKFVGICLILNLLLAACGSSTQNVPTATLPALPVSTSLPATSPVPSPTATLMPSPTVSPPFPIRPAMPGIRS